MYTQEKCDSHPVYFDASCLPSIRRTRGVSISDDFNGSSSNGMKLVFFDDAIRHVQRIVRIVRQPRGNAMLGTLSAEGGQMWE